jgi:hypothetical protein
MNLQAAFIFLVGDADQSTRAVVSTPSIDLNVIGCKNYAEAEQAAREVTTTKGVTAVELCAGFGNDGIARIQKAVGPNVAVGAVKFDFHPALGYKSGDIAFE